MLSATGNRGGGVRGGESGGAGLSKNRGGGSGEDCESSVLVIGRGGGSEEGREERSTKEFRRSADGNPDRSSGGIGADFATNFGSISTRDRDGRGTESVADRGGDSGEGRNGQGSGLVAGP